MYNKYIPNHNGMRPLYKWLIYIGIFIILFIIGVIIWFHFELSKLEDEAKPLDEPALMNKDNLKNNESILLIGTDKPSDNNKSHVRTDSMIIATYNKNHNSVKLLRLPRDIYVNEQGYTGKLNGLYQQQGIEGLVKYINHTFNIPISEYAMIDFEGLENVVDSIGGIDINSDITIDNSNNQNLDHNIQVYKGKNHLNGKEALGYSRIRYIDNDIKRGDRQVQVIKAIGDKILSPKALPKLPSVIGTMNNYVKTSMSASKIESNIKNLSSEPKMENLTFEWQAFDSDGSSYVSIDQPEVDRLSEIMRTQLNIQNSN